MRPSASARRPSQSSRAVERHVFLAVSRRDAGPETGSQIPEQGGGSRPGIPELELSLDRSYLLLELEVVQQPARRDRLERGFRLWQPAAQHVQLRPGELEEAGECWRRVMVEAIPDHLGRLLQLAGSGQRLGCVARQDRAVGPADAATDCLVQPCERHLCGPFHLPITEQDEG